MKIRVYAGAGVGNKHVEVIEGEWCSQEDITSDALEYAIQLTGFEWGVFIVDEETGEDIDLEGWA
jgi:hypothetical protein